MNENWAVRRGWALAFALLLILVPLAALASDSSKSGDVVTLTGQLSAGDKAGTYKLLDQESGDSIVLRGPAELADHVDQKVKVTGKWGKDAEGMKIFEVSKIEKAPEES